MTENYGGELYIGRAGETAATGNVGGLREKGERINKQTKIGKQSSRRASRITI